MRASFLILTVLLANTTGCLASAWQDVTEHFTDTATTEASTTPGSTTSETTPTTGNSGVQTVTGVPGDTITGSGATASTSSTTSPPEENEPPMVKFKAEPDHLDEAGQALLLLDTDVDVVKVRLSMNGEPLAELTPADFQYLAFEAFSAKDNTVEDHVYEVEVEDDGGLTASAMAKLSVKLPASGAERCLFEDKMSNGSMMSAMVYTDAAIVAGGWSDTGAGPRATIWKLDPDHCEETLPGWPKMIANWTSDEDDLDALHSLLSAIAVDETGNIAVGGSLVVGGKPQRYTALLTEGGGRLWERTGLVGEVVSSVVIADDDLVISGGWKFTNDNPPRTDAMIWRHLLDESVIKTTLKAPFTADEPPDDPNLRSEWIRAMLIEPGTGFLVVVGEREFKDGDNNIFTRAFIARFVPLGGPVGSPSTSPGDAYKRDAVYSIAVCGEELIAGGWTRDDEDPNITPPQPLFRWASNGVWSDRLVEPMLSTELRGAACDREGKLVGAGFRSTGSTDARVFAVADPLGPPTWYETGTAGSDMANGVVCDARGFCAWPGYRTYNGKPVAVVRVHHP